LRKKSNVQYGKCYRRSYMPIKYGNGKSKEYSTFQSEPEISSSPEIQNEEIVFEPPPPQEIPQYESPEVEEKEEKIEEENENGWELGEEDARNIAMIIISIASFFPYWPEKKRELEEKYGSLQEFQAQYEKNLQKALSHPWMQKVVKNISWLQHLTILPFIFQTFELVIPPQKRHEEEKIENVEIPAPQSTPENVAPKQQIVEGAFTIH
jgi:hypothetical protein